MQLKAFRDTGIQLPRLGFGAMRLPGMREGDRLVNRAESQKLIDYAMAHGINYFDSGFRYSDSEDFLGEALSGYPRESYYLATKMPGWLLKNYDSHEELFSEQLCRLRTDYIDFYLCHGVNEKFIEFYLKHQTLRYLEQLKAEGRIRYMGFSCHGTPETLKRYLDTADWDFVQIQLNYVDWKLQDAEQQYKILTDRGIPIMVMESARGGRLGDLSPEANAVLKEARPDDSIISWAFRFLMSLPNVQVILSGMNSIEQLEENIQTFNKNEVLNAKDQAALKKATDLFMNAFAIPCTGCRYCVEECPRKINIPFVLRAYNDYKLIKSAGAAFGFVKDLPAENQPDRCVKCGRCSRHCPQNIQVPQLLAEAVEIMSKM